MLWLVLHLFIFAHSYLAVKPPFLMFNVTHIHLRVLLSIQRNLLVPCMAVGGGYLYRKAIFVGNHCCLCFVPCFR